MSFTNKWLDRQLKNNSQLVVITGTQHTGVDDVRTKSKHKYSAQKTIVDGITFDSKKEATRYLQLKAMETAGEIENLKLQPVFLLQEAFTDDDGTHHRKIEYHADFSYWVDGQCVVEDTKGVKTAVFRIKWKLLLFRYRDKEIRFIVT